MPIECLISFEHNIQGVYYAGQELSGTVNLSVDTTKRIRAIHITVSGYAKVRWLKKGHPHDSERAMCRTYRSYLSSRSYVLGTCGTHTSFDWLAGEYSYTFHVILPDNLPTSFDGKYGHIHYEIITTIERPGRYPKVYKLPFTVIQPLDLNTDAIYRVPLDIIQRKRFWSFCCPTGPLTIKFSTPYCGYAPGQKINFVLYINNESSIDIMLCKVKLKQEVSYESHDPQHEYRYDRNLIAGKQFGNVLRWSRKVYRGYLELPSITPTSHRSLGCPINIQYAIKITIHPTEFHWKVKLKVPLTIGTVPIMENRHDHRMHELLYLNNNNNSINNNNNNNREYEVNGNSQTINDYMLSRSLTSTITSSNSNSNSNSNLNSNAQSPDRHNAAITIPLVEQLQQEYEHEHEQEPEEEPQQSVARDFNMPPVILVTNVDDPPDYIPIVPPPSYEEALAVCEYLFDETKFMENASLSSIVIYNSSNSNNNDIEAYKPRYPVFYNYETPVIPPETLYDAIAPRTYQDFINNTDRDAQHHSHHHHNHHHHHSQHQDQNFHEKTFKKINIFRKF